MPEVVSGVATYLPVFLLLALAGIAVGFAERRVRLAHAAAGAPWPGTAGYLPGGALAATRVETVRAARHPVAWLGLAATSAMVVGVLAGMGLFTDPRSECSP